MEGSDILRLKSLRELVYEHLHQAINSGHLEPGSLIDQKKLAAELGISRQPLRDALIQLELEGFVTVLPRRGVEVRRLTLDDIRHLYEVIGALESFVLLHAAARVRLPEAQRMHDLNEAMVAAIEAGDFDTYYDLNLVVPRRLPRFVGQSAASPDGADLQAAAVRLPAGAESSTGNGSLLRPGA